MKITKIFSLILFLGIFTYSIIPSAHSSIAGDNILITEVLYDTPGTDSVEEWFELFNPTDSAINLTGWWVEDNYDSFVLNGTIPAKGYFVAAIDATGFFNLYGYYANQSGGWNSFALANGGDKITLYDNDSVEVDFVAWEGYNGYTDWTITSTGFSSIRRINATDTDTVADWELSGNYGDPGFGTYDVIVVPELPQSLASVFLVLTGIATIVGLSKRKKRSWVI